MVVALQAAPSVKIFIMAANRMNASHDLGSAAQPLPLGEWLKKLDQAEIDRAADARITTFALAGNPCGRAARRFDRERFRRASLAVLAKIFCLRMR
jgi:hypothetical protein